MENCQTIVCSLTSIWFAKNSDVDFDFETQGIEMYADGDWVKQKALL